MPLTACRRSYNARYDVSVYVPEMLVVRLSDAGHDVEARFRCRGVVVGIRSKLDVAKLLMTGEDDHKGEPKVVTYESRETKRNRQK